MLRALRNCVTRSPSLAKKACSSSLMVIVGGSISVIAAIGYLPFFQCVVDNTTLSSKVVAIIFEPPFNEMTLVGSEKAFRMARIPESEIERLKSEVAIERLVEARAWCSRSRAKDKLGRCPVP